MKKSVISFFVLTISGGAFAAFMTVVELRKVVSRFFYEENIYNKLAREVSVEDFQLVRRKLNLDSHVEKEFKQYIVTTSVTNDEKGITDLLAALKFTEVSYSDRLFLENPRLEMTSKETSVNLFKQPTFNSIQLLTNKDFDIWILRQKKFKEQDFRTYTLVQDKRIYPNKAYYLRIASDGFIWRGGSCYECHANGPRKIRPLRPELVSNAEFVKEINDYISTLPIIETNFPEREPQNTKSERLHFEKCDECHNDVDRGALYSVHADASRLIVSGGDMPIGTKLTSEESYELNKWIEKNTAEKSWFQILKARVSELLKSLIGANRDEA